MKTRHVAIGAGTARVAEAQMRRWMYDAKALEQLASRQETAELPEQIHPYLTVSRELGAGGGEIALQASEQLGWELLNQDLLSNMADQYDVPRTMLEFVDESTSNWLLEVFGKWLGGKIMTQSEYVVRLGHVILMAAQHTSSVFVGRGAQFMLPRDRGIRIQIVAPMEQRIARLRSRRALTRVEAEKLIAHTDQGRHDFIDTYFHHDVSDPHLYDLVINREDLSMEESVDLIVQVCRQRLACLTARSTVVENA